ncbi:MAG: flagellar type III secretion system pore protein FliP [Pirellulaceae bacterium]
MIGQGEGANEYPALSGRPTEATRGVEPLEPLTTDLVGNDLADFVSAGPDEWTSPRGLVSTIKIMVLLTVLSLAPAILMMTTSFVRIVVVLGLLRQALGTQSLPPSQVITSLAMFMTLFVMAPTFTQVKDDAILPYIASDGQMSWEDAWEKGSRPIRTFMSHQIEAADNSEDVWLFFRHLPEEERQDVPETYDEVPLKVLLPAFLISELKVAFLIGFQIYLPFLVIDIVVSTVSIAMGMMMLPPSMISLPFKLILFVLVDGWHLVVGMLLDSFFIGGS